MPVLDLWKRGEIRALYGSPDDDPFRYPRTHEEWQERYLYLLDAYNGETYTQALVKRLGLFRALDDNGEVLGVTRRLYRDRIFLVDVAASAIAIGQVTLSPTEGASPEDVSRAEAIWRRSRIARVGSRWSKLLAICGDLHVEVVRTVRASGTVEALLVGHRPDTVFLEYGPYDNEPIRATITHHLMGDVSVDETGRAYEQGTLDTYQRTLTAQGVQATTEVAGGGEVSAEHRAANERASGPHSLGSLPLVHLIFQDGTHESEHGSPVTHGIDRMMAELDSTTSQLSAIGDRYGNPKLAIFGAKVTEGDKLSLFGRILNIFGSSQAMANVDAKYLEPNLTGASVILEHIESQMNAIRTTLPEYLFAGGGKTGLSGEALRLLATRFVSKYEQVRHIVYMGLEEALAKAVALEKGVAYDPEYHPIKLDGPALLPADMKAELEALGLASENLLRVDVIRRLQALGFADEDMTPEEYVDLLNEEKGERAGALFGADPAAQQDMPQQEVDPFAQANAPTGAETAPPLAADTEDLSA